jgi:hypothetical protein
MRPEDLRAWLLALPFRPFRLYLLEARTFEIHHSELVVVKRTTMDLYFSVVHPRLPLTERDVTIALLHITRIEAISPSAPALADGG